MRLVIDALAANRGGLATYVQGLLRGWSEVAPEDELTVLLTQPFGAEIAADAAISAHRLIVYPQRVPRIAWRIARAESMVPRLQGNADALVSTITTVPALWRKPSVATVHDLRHEDRPDDFTMWERLARRWYFGAAYRRADRLLAVSDRTARDLRRRHPATRSRISVVHHGADHASSRVSTRTGDAVAFGQYGAKEPALLLKAWQIVHRDSEHVARRLHIVGLSESQRYSLAVEAARLGVSDHVVLDPYLSAERFGHLLGEASAVLVPSRYEGFGLPVLEAMRQGIPVMISPDPALREVAGGHAACAVSWSPIHLAAAIGDAFRMTSIALVDARAHADKFTWRRAARLTRDSVETAVRGRVSR